MTSAVDVVNVPLSKNGKNELWRNIIAYWILGLCNNYGYVVMLSAANDILKSQTDEHSDDDEVYNEDRQCNYMSTGAILLADIIPSLIVKLVAPFIPFLVRVRVILCVLLSSGGFLIVAFSSTQWMSILGVVTTSLSSGLGEVTYLQYSSFYHKNVVSSWSSGTGAAGVVGALSYALLNSLGIKRALLLMNVVPLLMAITFWIILARPSKKDVALQLAINEEEINNPKSALLKKIREVPALLKYMVPLGAVYLFEYFINQGMFELIKFDDIFISTDEQYRWLQVDYQIGVFISRSSVNIIHIRHIWIMSVLQFANVIVFTTEAIFYYMPSFWIVLALTLWEGLLGGAAYVNTFFRISTEVSEEDKQFSMATTSFADTIGITLAGIFAIFAHNAICDLPKPERLLL